MATSRENSSMENFTLCSICFEKFKTPRFLPCTHSFCHGCLSSYIVSVCQSTEPRLGFNCPLCREYIPSPGAFDKPDEWAGLFPVNEVLRKIAEKSDQLLCEPCLRENEEESASDYCFSCLEHLCKMCTKCHRKSLSSRDHKVSPLSELNSAKETPILDISNNCATHKDEKVKLYCFDHEQPCCAMCVGMEHRECGRFDTIENVARVFRENGKVDSILDDVNKFKRKLVIARNEEEKNVTEIEDSVDKIIAKSEQDFKALVDHLQKLQKEHIEEVSSSLKKNRDKLKTCIGTLSDGIECAEYCSKMFEQARTSKNETEFMMKFHTSKTTYEHLKHVNFTRKRITISSKKAPILAEISNMTSLSDVNHNESSHQLYYDVRTVEISLMKEFSIDGVIYDGIFLSNGAFLTADHRDDGKCMSFDKQWVSSIFGEHLKKPFGFIENGEEVLVTCSGSKSIEVFSSSDFHKVRSIVMSGSVYGISSRRGDIYVACATKILKIDNAGTVLEKYNVEGANNINVIATISGLIVYSDWKIHKVTAITDQGNTAWEYTNPNLKCSWGLDQDSAGNIYVAGRDSNNIHVLSETGELIKVLEDIPNPTFFRLNEEMGIICVCTKYRVMKVFEIQIPHET